MSIKLVNYIENSFLHNLLLDESITDISYNGKDIYYMDNQKGRKKADLDIEPIVVQDFVRQIANLSEKQFSYSEPIIDISVGRYRFNAVHTSICRVNNDKALSFSLRIASLTNRVAMDKEYMNDQVRNYIFNLLKNNESIVIAGATGSGKTELQKYLISNIDKNAHIIAIDNIQELESLRQDNIDLTTWEVSPQAKQRTFEELIRNALRNNPDWLIIAESRGQEMADVLLSVMSGHPIITTLHAYDVMDVPYRIARMVQLANSNQKYDEILNDVLLHIHNYIFVKREVKKDGTVKRFISSIAHYDKAQKKMSLVYERNK